MRRRSPTVSQPTVGKPQQKRYNSCVLVPFGTPKTGRARCSLSKVCPYRAAQEFCGGRLISSYSKLLRAFDGQCRSPTMPKPKGMKRYAKVGILLGVYWGRFPADLLLRDPQMWYHESTNRRKRIISRKNVFLIVGKVPAEVVA